MNKNNYDLRHKIVVGYIGTLFRKFTIFLITDSESYINTLIIGFFQSL